VEEMGYVKKTDVIHCLIVCAATILVTTFFGTEQAQT
jgi:hypothetical protein